MQKTNSVPNLQLDKNLPPKNPIVRLKSQDNLEDLMKEGRNNYNSRTSALIAQHGFKLNNLCGETPMPTSRRPSTASISNGSTPSPLTIDTTDNNAPKSRQFKPIG